MEDGLECTFALNYMAYSSWQRDCASGSSPRGASSIWPRLRTRRQVGFWRSSIVKERSREAWGLLSMTFFSCRGQADRGEHFAVGRARGLAVGSDFQTIGFDAGWSGRSDA